MLSCLCRENPTSPSLIASQWLFLISIACWRCHTALSAFTALIQLSPWLLDWSERQLPHCMLCFLQWRKQGVCIRKDVWCPLGGSLVWMTTILGCSVVCICLVSLQSVGSVRGQGATKSRTIRMHVMEAPVSAHATDIFEVLPELFWKSCEAFEVLVWSFFLCE